MTKTIPTIEATAAKGAHLYAIYGKGYSIVCRVIASNRNQAARHALMNGHEVFSVNMEG